MILAAIRHPIKFIEYCKCRGRLSRATVRYCPATIQQGRGSPEWAELYRAYEDLARIQGDMGL